jgi:hypothetical protein
MDADVEGRGKLELANSLPTSKIYKNWRFFENMLEGS